MLLKSQIKNLREISQLSKGLSSKSLASEKLLLSGETSSILPGKSGRMIKHRVNFTPDYNLISDRTYPAPPKAIFHALLGDNSVVFRSQLSFASTKYFYKNHGQPLVRAHYIEILTFLLCMMGRTVLFK